MSFASSSARSRHDEFLPQPGNPHRYCASWEDMEQFRDGEVNFAILQRSAPDCKETLHELLRHPHRCVDFPLTQSFSLEEVSGQLERHLCLSAADRFVLFSDVATLAQHFIRLTRASKIQVHLHRVETDSCQYFHVDKVEARLLTTYLGHGTQWLRNGDINRRALGRRKNSRVLLPGTQIQSLQAGWVGVMKGEKRNAGAGLVHRSPSMARGGGARILLRMDLKC